MKVLLILADGMRPDSLEKLPYAQKLKNTSSYTVAKTVFPSVTLPCHMSLFHSVDPTRHGITGNIYMPQVRPIKGLCEQLRAASKKCAFFYDWEELRDLTRPDSLAFAYFRSGHQYGFENTIHNTTSEAIKYILSDAPDFTFLYFGLTDETGHKFGWMSSEYLEAVKVAWDKIEEIISVLPEEYCVIITADHGGHDRGHGLDIPEDMNIPMYFLGKPFSETTMPENVSILDIAPTITTLLGAEKGEDWEGRSII